MSNRPIPKPGQLPGIKPGGAAAPTPVTHVPASDPSKFGRVEDNGDAYGTGVDGKEKFIGSYQAGSPAEGLAHYGQRFDDLVCEVDLLATRLVSHPAEATTIKQQAEKIASTLDEQAVIGNLPAVAKTLSTIIADCDVAHEKTQAERKEKLAQSIARKEALAVEAEDIAANSTEWKAAGDRMAEIFAEWKTIRGIDRKTDDALWKRFFSARENFNRRRGAHFAELDRNRGQVQRVKEELIARAEEIKDSTDWRDTAAEFRDLMAKWKKAGRAHREVDNKLWARFKAAQDHFFDRRHADQAQRDEEFEVNATQKQELYDTYEPLIKPEEDLEGARRTLRELQEKWEAVGFVPRARVKEFEKKIGDLEKRVAHAADEQWRRTDPEAQARIDQFKAKVADFTQQAEAAEKKGQAAKAEKLRAQAAQWQEWATAAENAVNG